MTYQIEGSGHTAPVTANTALTVLLSHARSFWQSHGGQRAAAVQHFSQITSRRGVCMRTVAAAATALLTSIKPQSSPRLHEGTRSPSVNKADACLLTAPRSCTCCSRLVHTAAPAGVTELQSCASRCLLRQPSRRQVLIAHSHRTPRTAPVPLHGPVYTLSAHIFTLRYSVCR